MGEQDGRFIPGTVMARSEQELMAAARQGLVGDEADVHAICQDICTIVKGCVFEWCLNDGRPDIEASVNRIIGNYLWVYLHGEGHDEHQTD